MRALAAPIAAAAAGARGGAPGAAQADSPSACALALLAALRLRARRAPRARALRLAASGRLGLARRAALRARGRAGRRRLAAARAGAQLDARRTVARRGPRGRSAPSCSSAAHLDARLTACVAPRPPGVTLSLPRARSARCSTRRSAARSPRSARWRPPRSPASDPAARRGRRAALRARGRRGARELRQRGGADRAARVRAALCARRPARARACLGRPVARHAVRARAGRRPGPSSPRAVSFVPRTRLKNSTVSSSVSSRPSCRYGGESLMPRSGKVLIGPSALAMRPLIMLRLVEALGLQVVHEVVGVVRRRVAGRALRLAEEERLRRAAPARVALRRIELAVRRRASAPAGSRAAPGTRP